MILKGRCRRWRAGGRGAMASILAAQGRRGGALAGAGAGSCARTGTVEHIIVHGKSLEGNPQA